MGAILDTGTWRFKQFLISMSLRCLPRSFSSNWLTIWEQIWCEEFQNGYNGGHLGYQNETILAILNLNVAPMPPTKFGLNPTSRSGADVVWRFSRWPPWQLCWISERNDFCNSESPCPLDASHQISAQSDFRFRRRCRLKRFKMATVAAILDIGTERFSQFWISMSPQCRPHSFTSIQPQSNLPFRRRCRLKIFKMAAWQPSWIPERNDFSNFESPCPFDVSSQNSTQSDLRSKRCRLKIFKMAAVAAILDIKTERF